jgi:hypothetical protein
MRWVLRTRVAHQAYGQHEDSRRLLLRYEELLADTDLQVRRIVDWLGIAVPPGLSEIVDKASFAALPVDRRGPGQFARAASPGLWRERFTIAEQEVLARVMGEQLAILGYEPA